MNRHYTTCLPAVARPRCGELRLFLDTYPEWNNPSADGGHGEMISIHLPNDAKARQWIAGLRKTLDELEADITAREHYWKMRNSENRLNPDLLALG